jgi:hypothetical protein
MKRAHRVIVRTCSCVAGHSGVWIIGLALVSMVSQPRLAWGQSAWPSYPNNSAISVTSGGNVGIGTFTPLYALHLPAGKQLRIEGGVGGSDTASYVSFGGNGTFGIDAPGVYNGRFVVLNSGNVGVGTATPAHKFSVNGAIGATEVIVASSGADYVFARDYRLAPLDEVAAFVAEHHHLPDIPSAAEVQEKGLSLGDMQAKLLAKIEELTLHMIEGQRDNQQLRQRIARLEASAATKETKGQRVARPGGR